MSLAATLRADDAVRARIYSAAWSGRLEQVIVDATVVQPASVRWIGGKVGSIVRVAFETPDGRREEQDVPAANLLPAARRRPSNPPPRASSTRTVGATAKPDAGRPRMMLRAPRPALR